VTSEAQAAPCGCVPGKHSCDELDRLVHLWCKAKDEADEAMERCKEHKLHSRNEIARLNCQTCYEDEDGNVVASEDKFP